MISISYLLQWKCICLILIAVFSFRLWLLWLFPLFKYLELWLPDILWWLTTFIDLAVWFRLSMLYWDRIATAAIFLAIVYILFRCHWASFIIFVSNSLTTVAIWCSEMCLRTSSFSSRSLFPLHSSPFFIFFLLSIYWRNLTSSND